MAECFNNDNNNDITLFIYDLDINIVHCAQRYVLTRLPGGASLVATEQRTFKHSAQLCTTTIVQPDLIYQKSLWNALTNQKPSYIYYLFE